MFWLLYNITSSYNMLKTLIQMYTTGGEVVERLPLQVLYRPRHEIPDTADINDILTDSVNPTYPANVRRL